MIGDAQRSVLLQAYRVRLDTSTNWAVTTTSVLTVLAIGNKDVPHYFFAYIVRRHGLDCSSITKLMI